MSCWDWITEQMTQSKQSERIALRERYHEAKAYRRNLERLIGENMAEYTELDKEHRRVSHLEDVLRDDLDRLPK